MKQKLLVGVVIGAPVGMVLLTGLHAVVPVVFYRLPGGGQRCTKCHDLHGAIRMEDLKAETWIHLTGDVPQPAWIDTTTLFRTHQIDGWPGVTLLDLLAEHGCSEFRRVVVVSADGGHVSIESQDLTETARLVPRLGTARLADERLHETAWLWAIVEICVVANSPVIELNGQRTTFGALLAGARTSVPTESGRAALKEESTGRKYRNVTSRLVTGIGLTRLIDRPFVEVSVAAGGETLSFNADQVRDAILARDKHEGHMVLVLPRKSRNEWPVDVTAVDWR